MNKNDILKWVLIAGAAYLVYRYLVSQGIIGGKPTTAIEPGAETKPAAELPPAKPADFASMTRDDLYNYAKGRMPGDWDGRLTPSQWNWMVSNLTGVEQQRALSGSDSPIYVEEYLNLRKTAGISGLSRLAEAFGTYPMTSGWSM